MSEQKLVVVNQEAKPVAKESSQEKFERALFFMHLGNALIRNFPLGMSFEIQLAYTLLVQGCPDKSRLPEALQFFFAPMAKILPPEYLGPDGFILPQWQKGFVMTLDRHVTSTLERKMQDIEKCHIVASQCLLALPTEECAAKQEAVHQLILEYHHIVTSQCSTHGDALKANGQVKEPFPVAYKHVVKAFAMIQETKRPLDSDLVLTTVVMMMDLYDILNVRRDTAYKDAKRVLDAILEHDPMAQADYYMKAAAPFQYMGLFDHALALHDKIHKLIDKKDISMKRNMLLVTSHAAVANMARDKLCAKLQRYSSLMHGDSIFVEIDTVHNELQASLAALEEGYAVDLVKYFNSQAPHLNLGVLLLSSIEHMAALCTYWERQVIDIEVGLPKGSGDRCAALEQQAQFLKRRQNFTELAQQMLTHYVEKDHLFLKCRDFQFMTAEKRLEVHTDILRQVKSAQEGLVVAQAKAQAEYAEKKHTAQETVIDPLIQKFIDQEEAAKKKKPTRTKATPKLQPEKPSSSSSATAPEPEEEKAPVEEAPSLCSYAFAAFREGRLDEAERNYIRIRDHAQVNKNVIGEMEACDGLASVMQARAMQYYKHYEAQNAQMQLRNPTALYEAIAAGRKAEGYLQQALTVCKDALKAKSKDTKALTQAYEGIAFAIDLQKEMIDHHQQRFTNLYETLTAMRAEKMKSPGWKNGNIHQKSPAALCYQECVAQKRQMDGLASWHKTIASIDGEIKKVLSSDTLVQTGAKNGILRTLFKKLPASGQEEAQTSTVNAYIEQALASKGTSSSAQQHTKKQKGTQSKGR